MKLLYGTGNPAKAAAMQNRIAGLGIELISLQDLRAQGTVSSSVFLLVCRACIWASSCCTWSDEEQRLMATHHPFTMPNPDDIPLLDDEKSNHTES